MTASDSLMLPVCHQLFAAGWLGKGVFLPPQRLTPFTEQTLGRLAVCLAHLCEDALKAALLALLEVCRGKGILFPFPPVGHSNRKTGAVPPRGLRHLLAGAKRSTQSTLHTGLPRMGLHTTLLLSLAQKQNKET